MSFDLETLRRLTAIYGQVARIVITHHKGSAPRETGAQMFVYKTGSSGTIGGGALELRAITAAQIALEKSSLSPTSHTIPLGPNLGQCCGGSVHLVTEFFDPQNLPDEDRIFTRRITGPIAGATTAPLSILRSLKARRNASADQPLEFKDGWLIEAIKQPHQPVWIYGAGHVGRAIVETLNGLPFDITWVDTALDRFPTDVPNGVTTLVAVDPSLVVKHAPHNAQHFILTYSHVMDLNLCNAALSHTCASIGLIGSKTKWARFRSKLADLGHKQTKIAQINCPIGDPSLGKHPKAIALGIATGLIKHRASIAAQMKARP